MNGRHSVIVAAISLATSAPVFAGDSNSPAFTPRQMAHCMMKRVRANGTESYHDAFKACKSQFEAARSDHPADTAITAATQAENPKP
jgi:hypothetical protein